MSSPFDAKASEPRTTRRPRVNAAGKYRSSLCRHIVVLFQASFTTGTGKDVNAILEV